MIWRVFLLLGLGLGQLLAADKALIIGVTPNPFAPLLRSLSEDFKARGYELRVVEFNDYILPNEALAAGELDANLFQHKPFMDEFNKQRGARLIALTPVLLAPMGIYSKSLKKLDELKEGARLALPNDPTNESRALDLIARAGLIEFKPGSPSLKTPVDISKNPKNLKFVELKAAQLPRALAEVDAAVINSNYALDAGLSPAKDAIYREEAAGNSYVNYLVIRADDKGSEKARAMDELLRGGRVREFILTNYKDALLPVN